jgi:hypothetical protein
MAQHGYRMPVWNAVFAGIERAPEMGADAEHREVGAGDELAVDVFRASRKADVECVSKTAEHSGEHLVVIAKVGVSRIRQLVAVAPPAAVLRALCGDLHQFGRLGNRQQPKQHLVEQREDRGIRANAQRDRQDGDRREQGALRKPRQP